MPTYYRFDGVVRSPQGEAVPGVLVYVCTQPATTSTIPPSPLATIYADSVGTALANPVVVDGNGNFFFYAATGTYTILYFDPNGRVQTTVFPDQLIVTPGAGTVTSIALTMPAEFSVAGSPVATNGVFAVSKNNQNAGTVYAGPASGPAAAPTFQSLATLAAALGLGTGTVTSVNASITGSTLLSLSVSGNPIVTSGTLVFTVNFANQAANTFLRGPSSGGTGPIVAGPIVPKDLPGLVSVAFSATPTFDASAGNSFAMTLTGNVTSGTITNATAGQTITFIITQDGTGGWTFAFPSNVKGESNIGADAASVSVQSFIYTGSLWRATGPGSVNAT
jgi:hypothetical protein